MTRVTKFLAASSILALMAAPALAGGLIGGIDLGSTLHVESNAGVDLSGEAGASADAKVVTEGTTEGSTEGSATTTATADLRADLIGRGVWTKDGMLIGHVTETEADADADGQMRVVIAMEDGIESEVRRFSVTVAADLAVDGDLKLGWSQAELMTALSAEAAAKASNG